MVQMVSSNQILTSEESYRSALANAQKIKQAMDFTTAGQQVVKFSDYIQGYGILCEQFQARTKLGVHANLKTLHNELDVALQNLSAKVVTIAAKAHLNATASAPKSIGTTLVTLFTLPVKLLTLPERVATVVGRWHLGQKFKYATVAFLAGGMIASAPWIVWTLMTRAPGEIIPTVVNTGKELINTVPGAAVDAATLAVLVQAGKGALIASGRLLCNAMGKGCPPAPTSFRQLVATGSAASIISGACLQQSPSHFPLIAWIPWRPSLELPKTGASVIDGVTQPLLCSGYSIIESIRPGVLNSTITQVSERPMEATLAAGLGAIATRAFITRNKVAILAGSVLSIMYHLL